MMVEQKNLKFFITHSWRDNAFAQKLANDLRAMGFGGFIDIYSVKPGDDIPAEINRGLEASDVYIPILSSESLKSKWCEREINAALMLSAEPERRGTPRIIPILADDCRSKLPPLLKPLRYINFTGRYDEAIRELLKEGFGFDLDEMEHLDRERLEEERLEREAAEVSLQQVDKIAYRTEQRDLAQPPHHELPAPIHATDLSTSEHVGRDGVRLPVSVRTGIIAIVAIFLCVVLSMGGYFFAQGQLNSVAKALGQSNANASCPAYDLIADSFTQADRYIFAAANTSRDGNDSFDANAGTNENNANICSNTTPCGSNLDRLRT